MNKSRKRRGFTLIEVMIAIAIVVGLIAIVGINVIGKREEANVSTAKIQLNKITSAMDDFFLTFNRYPTEEEGVAVLWSSETLDIADDEEAETKWKAFLQKPTPKDLWGNEWIYLNPAEIEGLKYQLSSPGPDKEEGTEDDIKSWDDSQEDGLGGMPAANP